MDIKQEFINWFKNLYNYTPCIDKTAKSDHEKCMFEAFIAGYQLKCVHNFKQSRPKYIDYKLGDIVTRSSDNNCLD